MEEQNVNQPADTSAQTETPEPAQTTQPEVAEEKTERPEPVQPTETQTAQPTQEVQQTQEPLQSENDYQPDISQFLAPSTTNIQPDEDGYIDPNKFYNSVMQDVERKLEFQRQEERAWRNVEKQYPEIVEDKELRDLVHAARLNDVTRGGKGDLNTAAKQVFNKLQAYKSQGKAQAQISETVQKSATLQTQTAKPAPANSDSDLIDRMSRGDKVASETLISKWLEEGKI